MITFCLTMGIMMVIVGFIAIVCGVCTWTDGMVDGGLIVLLIGAILFFGALVGRVEHDHRLADQHHAQEVCRHISGIVVNGVCVVR